MGTFASGHSLKKRAALIDFSITSYDLELMNLPFPLRTLDVRSPCTDAL